jgi:hypothetical protein
MKRVDARTLASAGCVSKLRHRTAQDGQLWELICIVQLTRLGVHAGKLGGRCRTAVVGSGRKCLHLETRRSRNSCGVEDLGWKRKD